MNRQLLQTLDDSMEKMHDYLSLILQSNAIFFECIRLDNYSSEKMFRYKDNAIA